MLGALPQYYWCGIELSRYSGFICHRYKVLLFAAAGVLKEEKKKKPAVFRCNCCVDNSMFVGCGFIAH
jgi:hypothetical protein